MFTALSDNSLPLIWSYEDKQFYPLGCTSGVYTATYNSTNKSFSVNTTSYDHSSVLLALYVDNPSGLDLDLQLSLQNLEIDEWYEPLGISVGPAAINIGSMYRPALLKYIPFRLNGFTINLQEPDPLLTGEYSVEWSVLLLS